jgi:hypothetical protein
MKSKILLAVLAATALVVGTFAAPVLAFAVGSYLNVDKAVVVKPDSKWMTAIFSADDRIPKRGPAAFGYGVVTVDVLNLEATTLAVMTTHEGVCDSDTQSNIKTLFFDEDCKATWHTHLVTLEGATATDGCAPNTNPGLDGTPLDDIRLKVKALTWESPGLAAVIGSKAAMGPIPVTFSGTDAASGASTVFTRGTEVAVGGSFTLNVPNYPDGGPVCVENLTPAEETKVVG